MQVIPDNVNKTAGIRVFETPDDIIINGQIYDKATFEPKPYHFFTHDVLDNYNLLDEEINRVGEKNAMPDKGVDYKYIMQDSEDPNIFYAIYFINGDSATLRLGKFQKVDYGYKLLQSTYYNSPNTAYNQANTIKFLGQNTDYILVSENHRSYGMPSGYANYPAHDLRNICLRRISKSNISSSVYIILYSNNNMLGYRYNYANQGTDSACFSVSYYLMKITEAYANIFLYCGDAMYIVKYNIQNNTWTTIYTFPSEYINSYSIGPSNIINFNNKYYIITGNTEHTNYELQEITLASSGNSVTIVHYTISHTNFAYSQNGYRTHNGICSYTYLNLPNYLVYTLKNIDNKYIGLVVHHNEGGLPMTSNNKLMLIKKTDSGFTITQCFGINSCYGVLWYDDYTCVILTQNGFTFYKVNTNTDTYYQCYEETGTFLTIGFDAMKRFYAITASECKIYSNITAVTLNAIFEKTSYTYDGTSYDSYITVSTRNFINEFISTEVLLTLQGTCQFTDGSKEKLITTTTSTMRIPIVITGGGKVYCNIKQVGVE